MNINDHRISDRQLGRLYFYDLIALPSLLLPRVLSTVAGASGWLCLLIGEACGYVVLTLVLAWMKNMQMHNECNRNVQYPAVRRIACGAVTLTGLAVSFAAAAAALWLLSRIVCVYLLQGISVWLVLVLAVLLTAYGLSMGLESRGRRYELLYTPVLVVFVLFLFFAAGGVKPERLWRGMFFSPLRVLAGSGISAVGLLVSLFLPLYAGRTAGTAGERERALRGSFFRAAVLQLLFFLVQLGNFGAPTLATLEYPVLELGAAVHMTTGFLERQDAVLCCVWLIPLFAFAEDMLYAAGCCAKRLCRETRPDKKSDQK